MTLNYYPWKPDKFVYFYTNPNAVVFLDKNVYHNIQNSLPQQKRPPWPHPEVKTKASQRCNLSLNMLK